MKRLFFIIAMFVCISFAGYSKTTISKDELRQVIALMNASLPEPAGILGTTVSAGISRDTVVMKYVLSNEFLRIVDNLDMGKKDYKNLTITQLSASFEVLPESKILFEAIEENALTLKLILDRDKNQNFFNVVLTPADLKKILNGKPDYKKLVDMILAQGKLTYPVVIGPMTMTDGYLRDNKVYYLLMVDESQIDFKTMQGNKDIMRLTFINQMKQSRDLSAILQLYYNASAGYDTIYEYRGSESGESIYIVLTPADVFEIVDAVR